MSLLWPTVQNTLLVGLIVLVAVSQFSAPAYAQSRNLNDQTSITIISGSTNNGRLTLVVHPDGSVLRSDRGLGAMRNPTGAQQSPELTLAPGLVNRLYADVNHAMPLQTLPVVSEPKSASFGKRTMLIYRGQRSPDVSGANQSDARVRALNADITEIFEEVDKSHQRDLQRYRKRNSYGAVGAPKSKW